ncbi:glutamate--tRNA ligase [Sporichthya sp.]|uniref:glutamate--tRNA ligase n=1 Tax=Sporichthya sp. TaxID=65475 RepID=UPI001824F9E5|nr:glutamate--tRNA ligase [Sporichthya sp.]MBA3741746.1 glutamate--tRNA ligase [Sporichthya sp.]
MTDSTSKVRVRFAPSPSGDLHVGNIRTALYDWAYARHTGGTFVFRIEDTDSARVTPEYIAAAVESMRWLGLDWDEGPEVGGDHGPYQQSERIDLYREWAQRFIDNGHAYHCYESPAEAEERVARQKAAKAPPGYDGHSRNLTPEQRAAYEAEGRKPVVRFRMPEGTTTLHDLIRGEVSFDNALIPDFVLMRADGSPLYTLAVAVDDVLMKITHVVRGEDLLSSTPRQIAVYRAMGVTDEQTPSFAHLPFVMGQDNSKLSKRHGAVTIGQFRADGYLPEAMCNYLALLGWSLGDGDREEFDLQEMAAAFTLERVNSSPARFDPKKLDAINGTWIRRLDPKDLANRIVPFLVGAGLLADPPSATDLETLAAAVPLVQERMITLGEVVDMVGFLFISEVTIDPDAAAAVRGPDAEAVLKAGIGALEALAGFSATDIEAALRAALIEGLGLKPKNAFGALRVAVTGRRISLPLFESMELLGRDATLARLRAGLAALS